MNHRVRMMLVIMVGLVWSLFVMGQSTGLRTITQQPPTIPETKTETNRLPSVDPLVSAFLQFESADRKTGWREETIGRYLIHIPDSFQISSSQTGREVEAAIYDEEGYLFCEIMIYLLESYTTYELVEDLVNWLFPGKTDETSLYEEWIALSESQAAYTTKIGLLDHDRGLPFYFLYQQGLSKESMKAGEMLIMIFYTEPYESSDQIQTMNERIIGVSESLMESWRHKSVISTVVEADRRDPLIVSFAQALEIGEFTEPGPDWTDYQHVNIEFALPPYLDAYYFDTETGLVGSDIAYQDIIVGKIITGYSEGLLPVEGEAIEIIDLFLSGLGTYQLVDHESWSFAEDSVNVWRLDFPDYACWLVFYSESSDADFFGNGEFFIFFGIAPLTSSEEVSFWSDQYATILWTLGF